MQGSKILLLDDDRETRWALSTILRREGAQVTEGADGEAGLRFLARGQFDLCVADVCMPGLGGYGVFAAIRFAEEPEMAWAKDLPVILISGKAPAQDLAKALDAGADDVMAKPCDPEEFKARVRAVLRRSRLLKSPRARTRGELSDFGTEALAQALHMGGRSARLHIQTPAASGVVDFLRGDIGHAVYEEMGETVRGEEAAIRTLILTDGAFELMDVPESAPRTVFSDTASILLRAATFRDETTGSIGEALAKAREFEKTRDFEEAEAAAAAAAANAAAVEAAVAAADERAARRNGTQELSEDTGSVFF